MTSGKFWLVLISTVLAVLACGGGTTQPDIQATIAVAIQATQTAIAVEGTPRSPEIIASPTPIQLLPTVTPVPSATPDTKAAQAAIALVRNSPDMADSAQPYVNELDWYAEQQDDKWWVIGLFESLWGVRFVRDAAIWDGRVYAYTSYSMRPSEEWVISKARERWGLTTFYTRLTPEIAIERVKESEAVRYALRDAQVLDAVAELIEDNAVTQQWRFAFYVQRDDGSKAVLVVGGLGTVGAEEGTYWENDYGFGNATEAYWDIPLNFSDWIRELVTLRGWTEANNVK